MKIKVIQISEYSCPHILGKCPHCGAEAVLEQINAMDVAVTGDTLTGQRRCPNPACRGHLFVIIKSSKLIASYPQATIDFNSTNIPDRIVQSFREAIKSHSSECFIASAIMVRRTLEEICEDKSAKGPTLKSRLTDLRSKIVLPQELLDAMDELRLLGNDAAHVEAKEYENIGKDELEAAIDLTKEIMKGIYQYSSLLMRLKALKSKP